MRAKVILSASVLALAVMAPALYFHFKSDSPPPAADQPATVEPVAASPALPSILQRVAKGRPMEGLPTRPAEPDSSAVDHETYVIQQKAKLTELGMSSEPANLGAILSELENPEPEIRKTALSAAVDFGSKDAIPTLQNEMNWATDPQEKLDIKKAIEFLQLPHLGSSGAITQQSADSSAPATN